MFLYILFPLAYTSIAFPLIEKKKLLETYITTHIEILILVFVTNVMIGYECGFNIYLFGSITASFYYTFMNQDKQSSKEICENNGRGKKAKTSKKVFLPLVLTSISIISFLVNYGISKFLPAFYPVTNPVWNTIFYTFNMIVVSAIILTFSYLFVWELENRQRVLATQNERLDELAHKDPLTHLLNRRSMDQMIVQRMEQLKTSGKRFTMILGDIDDFKKVNDTYGHDAGDMVLVAVADTIMHTVRSDDAVCRWGGEEILILVHDPLETASIAAERIRQNVEKIEVPFEDKKISITMTFGIAESIPGYRIEHLVQQADDKLYYGKKHGKNQLVANLPEENAG
ncbi:MAG: GGDEF domain-containing protein [Lachnospiraceae bacterium]|nr:GGDEF domain-containing protein [Lachnospiraceae bacterium]